MRSYEAARSLFSFLGFCAWAVIILGGIAALIGARAAAEMAGYGRGPSEIAVLTGLLPGLALSFVGFIGLALVQIGRAAVDTAEYTQQMLKIARDQLDVSRQGLNQGKALEQGFAALKQVPEERPTASFADAKSSKPSVNPEPLVLSRRIEAPSEPAPDRVAHGLEDGVLEYAGKTIKVENGKALYNGISFDTLGKAKDYVDSFASKKLPGAHRS